MEGKVSIIIPAYNVEKYIFRAIESSLEQTYNNVEVIIVDDGSTDNTWNIINEYKEKDERIIAFRQANLGVSSARNRALQMATGKYVIFLDSDDWIEKNTIEYLIQKVKNKKDYLVSVDCYYAYLKEEGNIDKNRLSTENVDLNLTYEETLKAATQPKYRLQSSCYKIYLLSIIKDNNLEFDVNIRHGEDGLFVFKYLHYIKGFNYINIPLWNILKRPNSATTSQYNKYFMTAIDAVKEMMKLDNPESVHNSLEIYMVQRAIYVLRVALECTTLPINDIKKIRLVLKKYKNKYISYEKNIKKRIYFLVMTFSPVYFLSKYLKRRS